MLTLNIKAYHNHNFDMEKNKTRIPPLKWNEKNKDIFKNHMKAPSTLKLIHEIEKDFANDSAVSNDDILKKINFLYTYNVPKLKSKI